MTDPVYEQVWVERLHAEWLFSLDSQTVVVTGAAGGVGSYLALGFGHAGATLLLTNRDGERLDQVVEALVGLGVDAHPLVIDLEDGDAASRIVEVATRLERHGFSTGSQ